MNEDNKYDLIFKDTKKLYNTIVANDPKDIVVPTGMELRKHITPTFKETYIDEPLDLNSFIELLESVGGASSQQIMSIYESEDLALKLFFIKAKNKIVFTPEDSFVISGLDAMEQYIPNGKESIISNWPKMVILNAV